MEKGLIIYLGNKMNSIVEVKNLTDSPGQCGPLGWNISP